MSKHEVAERRGLGGKLVAVCGFAIGAYLILVIVQPIFFEHRFGYGSQIAGVDVSMKSDAEAKQLLTDKWNQYSKGEVTFQDRDVAIASLVTGLNVDESVSEAENAEQQGYFGLSKYFGQDHSVDLEIKEDGVSSILSQMYDEQAVKPVDAVITNLQTGKIKPEVVGQRMMLTESRESLLEGLSRLRTSVSAVVVPQPPLLTAGEAETLLASVKEATGTPVKVSGTDFEETLSTGDLSSWVKITPKSAHTLVERETFLPVADSGYNFLDSNKVYNYVSKISGKINKSAVNATLGMTDGKLAVINPSVIGASLDSTKAANDLQSAVLGDHNVTLAISQQKPAIREDNLSELGITEQIAEGTTDAAGSPKNRIVNYTVGTAKFNGVLIKPGEDFSFNKALGNVDASTGYLPELVILENKTVPEYGGGLCQVSSTAFRAALNAGLPILERHNHAYPVGYYKPYGVDATIYLPSPDLRFTNDTGHYILIQTKVVGTHVYFDFYGTKKPGKVTFSGAADAKGEVPIVEQVSPAISDQEARGPKSFTAVFYRHIYDAAGKMTDNDKFTSKYDTPNNYPH